MTKEFSFTHTLEVLVKFKNYPDQGAHKMAAPALAECNDLLSSFICGLDPHGNYACHIRGGIFVMPVSRGFNEAGGWLKIYGMATTTISMGHLINLFVNMGKKFLPMKIKIMIKAVLRSVIRPTAGESEGRHKQLKEKFSEVYEKNIFGGSVSRSGGGSDLVQTEIIRRELPRIAKEFSIHTFLDAPCGDFYWMKETNLGVEQYIGVDIVEAMIEKHKKNFGNPARTFLCLNLATDPLPKADLIFSRDCLVHLSFDDALKVIANFKKSGAKYLLTTTFTDRASNNDLVGVDNFWRTLNMCLAPFNFPEPILVVNEGCIEGACQYKDKSLGLWLLRDINA